MHSVRIELAKLILVCTRITYQATGDAVDLAKSSCSGGYDIAHERPTDTRSQELTYNSSRGAVRLLWYQIYNNIG